MANKPKGKSRELYFAQYQTTKKQEANRLVKLLRLQKQQPNNEQIAAALKDIHYRRGTPKVEVWSHSGIATAKMFKRFTGKFDKGVLVPVIDERSSKVHAAAVRVRNEHIFEHYKGPTFNQNSMFSIKERAHSMNGMRVWL